MVGFLLLYHNNIRLRRLFISILVTFFGCLLGVNFLSARIQERKGKMIVAKAGRKGEERTASTHGREFYEKIGYKGDKKRLRAKVQNSTGKFAVQVDKVAET